MRPMDREQNPNLSNYIQIQCPYCSQAYRALESDFEEDRPDFECSACHKEFWIEVEDTQNMILGKPSTMQKPITPVSTLGVSTKVCPRCTEEVPINEQKCSYCGVVFIKMIEGWGSSFELRGQWAEVIKRWHDNKVHDDFIQACNKKHSLVYGISCYGRILKEDKNNKKALEMIKRMEALTWFFEEEAPAKHQHIGITIFRWLGSHTFDALVLSGLIFFVIYLFM